MSEGVGMGGREGERERVTKGGRQRGIKSNYNLLLQIMGNASEFHRAAQLVVDHVTFDRCTTVQVFEATIRYIG